MDNIIKLLSSFWKIIKYILFPEMREYNYEIIADSEISKMRRDRAAAEYIRSRRRINEYAELVDLSFKRKYKLIILFTLIILSVSLLVHYLQPNILKIGDIVIGVIPFFAYLFAAARILFFPINLFVEDKITGLSLPRLKKLLRLALKQEWRYMEFHNKRMASSMATLVSMATLIIVVLISSFRHPEKPSVLNSLVKLFQDDCETIIIPYVNYKFNSCNYVSGRFIYISFLFYITTELSSIFSGLLGAGNFFRSQSFKPNFISSTYLDNLSLSVLNPNQHEAI